MNFKDLAAITEGSLLADNIEFTVGDVLFDTRLRTPGLSPNTLFLAIKGVHHDGNLFIDQAFKQGIRQFIVETDKVAPAVLQSSNVLHVSNSIEAIQKIAAAHRSEFHIPIIAITGSNGKTVVKEWVSTLLQSTYEVVKSPASFNSQLGVALSLLKIASQHTIGVFEAGISRENEMTTLSELIAPTIGIFTNIGSAHDHGFHSVEEKIKEKVQLFAHSKAIIYSDKQPEVVKIIESTYSRQDKQLIKWGENGNMQIHFDDRVTVQYLGNTMVFPCPFQDPISQDNLGHCLALMTVLKISEKDIRHGLHLLRNIPKRLSIKKGVNNSILLDDSYNNDTVGLTSALTFMHLQQPEYPILLILSDILESSDKNNLYAEVAEIIQRQAVSEVLTVGDDIEQLTSLLSIPIRHYASTELLLSELRNFPVNPSRIVVKGARPFQFEKVVDFLSEKIHGTRLEMNMHHLVHNLNVYKSHLQPSTKIMAMVKAFAYGSSAIEVAHLLDFHRIDYLGVAYADEGLELRTQGLELPIMVMNPTTSAFQKMISNNLEPEIFSFPLLHAYGAIEMEQKPGIHIKLDTGMHRLGFSVDQVQEVAGLINKYKLKVASIFSHLAGADNAAHDAFSQEQIDLFVNAAKSLKTAIAQPCLLHVLNSSGIVRFPEAQCDMVRLGIGLQGYDPTGVIQDKLLPVSRLVSTVSHIQEITGPDTVGYDRNGKVAKKSKVATIAVGYADGFRRSLGNGRSVVSINSHRYPTIGNVCMDMTMIDVTDSDVAVGDEVELFGPTISLEYLSKAANTIPYEILTSISPRVERVFLYE